MKPYVCLNASDVATAICKNPYKSQNTMLARQWKIMFPKQYEETKKRLAKSFGGETAPKEVSLIMEEIKRDCKSKIDNIAEEDNMLIREAKQAKLINEVKTLYEERVITDPKKNISDKLLQSVLENAKDLKQTAEKVSSLYENIVMSSQKIASSPTIFIEDVKKDFTQDVKDITNECKTIHDLKNTLETKLLPSLEVAVKDISFKGMALSTHVPALIRSGVSTTRGCKDEHLALENVAKETSKIVRDSNTRIYSKIIYLKPFAIRINGKVDGWLDEKTITEVKNRQRYLFQELRLYEEIQVQIYLYLTGAEFCHFSERYEEQFWSKLVKRDDVFWNDVVILGLQNFVDKIKNISEDESLQEFYYNQ